MFWQACFLFTAAGALLLSAPHPTLEDLRQCFASKLRANGSKNNLACVSLSSKFWANTVTANGDGTSEESIENYNEDEDLDFEVLKETGLEFFGSDYQLNVNEKFYFNENGRISGDLSPLEVTDLFIRELKGIARVDLLKETLGSGSRTGEKKPKPDWNFLPYRMKDLVKVEIRIYELVKEFYESEPELHPFPALESYLKDIEQSSLKALEMAQSSADVLRNPKSLLNDDTYLYIATHPLLIYRMIRRFVYDLQPILLELISFDEEDTLLDKLHEVANPDSEVFPTENDLEESLTALKRTQLGVWLKTNDFARGKLETVETGLGLNALHALEVGMYLIEEGHYDLALEWIYLATKTIRKSPLAQKYPFIQKFFSSCMNFAIEKHNSIWKSNYKNQWTPGVYNSTVEPPFNPSSYVRVADLNVIWANENRNLTHWNAATKINFYQTCAGRNLQSEKEKAALKCYNDRRIHPYWYINPLKVEILHTKPLLFEIHDFIGEKLTEKIKARATRDLKRSTVVDKNHPSQSVVDSTRTSTQTWIFDAEQSGIFMRPLTRRMEMLSGLIIVPTKAQDAFQVALYGPSHHYEAHIDSFEDPRRTVEKGNRIVTIMGYLSDTEVGGRTGFPVLGTYADPKKGSIIMWHNMLRHMEDRDLRTWHGGCPVVLGTKWITNKWVYSDINIFRFTCGLTPDAEVTY